MAAVVYNKCIDNIRPVKAEPYPSGGWYVGWCSVADRRKKPEHDDAWWADQRHAYIEKNDILLSDYPSWEWVSPYDFWRTIFPEGFLQPRGEEVPWRERGGGHPNGIAIQITNRTKTVKTKTAASATSPWSSGLR